jgi:hypothetical protein
MANPKTGKASAPKKPVDVDVDYFFCSNVNCNYHASFLIGQRPEEAGFVVGGLCPQCGIGTISLLQFKQKADVPLANATVTAQALPALPYGGMPLRLGDTDNGLIFGGAPDTDPRHAGAHFVAELQRDLLRLGFYGPARGGETVGVFSQMLHGGVLDLKRHLVKFYGVPALEDFTLVQQRAADADKARAQRAAERAQTRTALGIPGGDTPQDLANEQAFEDANKPEICFLPGGLVGPNEVYSLVQNWSKTLGLGPPTSNALLVQTFEKWAARWQKQKSSGFADTPAGFATLKANIVTATAGRDTLKTDLAKANADQRTLAARIASSRGARARLTEAQISVLEQSMDALIAELNTLGAAVPATLSSVKSLDAQLPLASAPATEPAPSALTMTATAPADTTPPSRFDRVTADDTTARQVLRDLTAIITFIDVKVGNPKQDQKSIPRSLFGRESQLEKDVTARDELGGLLTTTVKDLDKEIQEALAAATLLDANPGKGPPTGAFVFARQNAITRATFWSQQAGPPPTGTGRPLVDGTIFGLIARMTQLEQTFAASSIALPPEWPGIKADLGTLAGTVVAYRDEIQKSNATTLMDSYVQLLRRFGKVDAATARYIRRMVTDGRLGSQPVFRVPQGNEVLGFDFVKDLAAAVDETAKEKGRPDAPEPIVRFIFTHESGGIHAKDFGGSKVFVKLGIDWRTPGDASFFKERETSGQQLSSSRGWGMTQTTFFDRRERLVLTAGLDASPPAPAAGPTVNVRMNSGIPYASPGDKSAPVPFVIASARENAKSGIGIYIDKFRASQAKRECTFVTRHDCVNCVKNLAVGSRQLNASGNSVVKGGMVFFKEEEGNFDRVLVNGRVASHRFRDVEDVKDLVASGNYSLPGKTLATISEADTLEFPCSWLTAVTNYAGTGQIAWYYALNAIVFLQTGKLPK